MSRHKGYGPRFGGQRFLDAELALRGVKKKGFDKRGNYVDPDDPIGEQLDSHVSGSTSTISDGERFDGTENPLGLHPVPGMSNMLRGTMSEALNYGKTTDTVNVSGLFGVTVDALRKLLLEMHHLTPEQFARLKPRQQNKITKKLERFLSREIARQHPDVIGSADPQMLRIAFRRGHRPGSTGHAGMQARDALHASLTEWAKGPLSLEKPPASSLHHLLQYDTENGDDGDKSMSIMHDKSVQIIVVENDWARALEGVRGVDTGHVPTPFELCCWEFRISGVRVMAFTHSPEDRHDTMWLTYGRDGHWVQDDYIYEIDGGRPVGHTWRERAFGNIEFDRVMRLVHANIRASCIMIDARIARQEKVAASCALNKVRSRTGKVPLRDHYVVRLLREKRVHYSRGGTSAPRREGDPYLQRGHFRMGTYVHYDDQDSGEEQYVNDGGFIVSKTWRRWHFAGDPNNLIHKEYRL